jgi:hypothetical protein
LRCILGGFLVLATLERSLREGKSPLALDGPAGSEVTASGSVSDESKSRQKYDGRSFIYNTETKEKKTKKR